MNSALLSQSKYYHPSLNSAIFDGPFRIYFAKPQETLALKIYFELQEAFKNSLEEAKELFKALNHNIYIMLYPNKSSFNESFDIEKMEGRIPMEIFGQEFVLGLNAESTSNSELDLLFKKVEVILKDWKLMAPREDNSLEKEALVSL